MALRASITASATLHPLSRAECASWRTEGRRGTLHGLQDRSPHGPGLLPEKARRRRGPVRTRAQQVVDRGATAPLPGGVESSPCRRAQRERPRAPCPMGAGALAHLGERLGLRRELGWRPGAARAHGPSGRKQGAAPGLGTRSPRRHIPWPSLLAPRARAARDGGPHGGDHRRGGLEALQAGRAQGLVLGHATDGVEGLRDRPGSARAVTPYAALQGNPVGGVAAGAEARRDRLARRAAALGVVASRVHVLRHRLQARCLLRGVTWTTRCGLAVGVVVVRLPPVACLWCL